MDPLLLQTVVNGDHAVFQLINQAWANPVFDAVLPFLTDLNKQPWLIPAIAIACVFWILKQRMRAVAYILLLVLAVGASDFVTYRVIKSTVQRDRPEQAGVKPVLRTTSHSGSSFPSNHAANAFAGASVLSAALPVATPLWYLLAFLIAYSRVYVGVHFPLDVLAGAIVGWTIAFMLRIILQPLIIKAELSEEHRFERDFNSDAKKRRKDLLRKKS